MPQIIPFVAAAIAALGVGATTATVIATVLVSTLVAVGSSLAATALAGNRGGMSDRGPTLSFRAAAPAAPIIYGQTRVGGPVMFMHTSGVEKAHDNRLLWLFIALAGHEVEEIGDIYFSDEVIPFDDESTIYSAFDPTLYTFYGAAQGVGASAPGGGLRSAAFRIRHLGGPNQTADKNARAAIWGIPDIIAEGDTYKGIAYVSVQLKWVANAWPSGPPNISAMVKGRKVYDPREPSHDIADPSTWDWSDNAALCVADYLRGCPMDTGGGVVVRPYGVQASDEAIDWDSVATAANICDESVAKASGGFEKRYTCNGLLDSDLTPEGGLRQLLSAMAGSCVWSGGVWKIFAGAYRTPSVTLGDDDQCGPSRTQAKRARRDLFNGVKGKFRGPKTFYQTTDFPRVSAAAYVAEDNGEEIWQDIELPFTDQPSAAQRIARIELLKNRQQIVTERRFKLSALGTAAGDTILLNDARKGWVDKPFEIARWSLVSEMDEAGQPFLAIDMTLVETSSGVYAWTADDEFAFDDAPDTNLPRPWEVALPGAPGIVEALYQTRDGSGVKTRVTVSWADAFEGYFLDYVVEYKLTSSSTWIVLPPVTGTFIELNDFAAGIYDFRVKTRNTLGVFSEYSTSTGLNVYGLGAAPSTLSGLGIQPLGNQAMLAWTQSADLDVREGGYIEFRHSPSFSGVTWETAASIREAVNGTDASASVPLKAGTYLVRAVDSSGIPGPAATVTSKQASINGYTSLAGSPLTEETAFSGTKTNTVASASVLKLANAGMWDDIADLDALATNVDDTGGLSAEGSYTFNSSYDFGAVTRVRLTSKLAVTVTNILSNIDDRAGNIDDWDDFDGSSVGSAADAWVEYRQTDDNPAGSPTWSAWMRLDAAEAECRAVQCRAQLRSYDPAYNIEIATLQVAAEQRS